ncbi:MAG: M20/M25/M40 family metallo-hydrolase [bacterium]
MNDPLVDLFLELVQIDGTSAHEGAVRDYLLTLLRSWGLNPCEDSSTSKHGGESGNLICPVAGGGERLIVAHMDTVRPTKQLVPKALADRITSSGTTILGADDRAGIAAILNATKRLLEEKAVITGFTIAFTVREETDSAGAIHMEIPEAITHAVVFDSQERPGYYISHGYGAKKFSVMVTGRAAHAGVAPEKGISAILVAAKSIAALPWGRIDKSTTANVGTFEGGTATNVIAESATVVGEIRSLTKENVEKHFAVVRTAFEREAEQAGASVELTSHWDFLPYVHEPNGDVRGAVEKALRDCGLDPTPTTSAGGSDANEFNARNLPTIVLGIGSENPHGNDEYILIEDLHSCADIAYALMRG